MARTENRVRNLLKTHGNGHNTSTDSASIVRRVYIAILPPEMPEPSQWPQMQYFVVATGLERKCIAYAHLHQHNTVGEYLATLHRQASKRLIELETIPLSQMRILGLDWRGKIYKQFTQHNQQLRGDGVYSYSVDVIAMPPIRHQVASPARVEHDNDDDDDTIEIESAEGDDELDHSKNRSSGGGSSRSSNNDYDNERHTHAPSPVWENFDVYHITQYGDGEDYIAPPTNICLDISRLERITGELIMDEVLYASRLSPNSLRYNTMRLVAQVILRGSFMTDSVRLACDQCITPEVLREVGSKVRCILIDHTECMFASSMMSGGSGSPSPGRTPVKTVKQRAPEAVIRIAD
ncbi:Hypothetical protein, putative [Bodo saltans]|uniref:Uncharacterized protein n=1 Tax=Bodo saltans TaxID=75058 RepID=A0A0S4KLV4_BODSA|nr:Hypothetical protein, putative [Bodo saltans]|eukprot:CUI15594.1 Hypothetical protein, putative [Bodo saltans]